MISQIKKTFYRWVNSEGSPNSLMLAMALGVASFGILLSFLAFQSPVFEPSPGKPMVAEIDVYSGPSSLTGTGKSSASALPSERAPSQAAEQASKSNAPVASSGKAKEEKVGVQPQIKVGSGAEPTSPVLATKPKAQPQQAKPSSQVDKPAMEANSTQPPKAQAKPLPSVVLEAKPLVSQAQAAPEVKTVKGNLAQPSVQSKPALLEAKPVKLKALPANAKAASAKGVLAVAAKPAVTVSAKPVAAGTAKPVAAGTAKPGVSNATKPGTSGAAKPAARVEQNRVKATKAQAPQPLPKPAPPIKTLAQVRTATIQVSTQAAGATTPSSHITFSMPPGQQAGSPNLAPVAPLTEVIEPVAIEPIAVEPLTQLNPTETNPERLCTRIRQVGQDGAAQAMIVETMTMGNADCMYP